jgi:hypothetical protein
MAYCTWKNRVFGLVHCLMLLKNTTFQKLDLFLKTLYWKSKNMILPCVSNVSVGSLDCQRLICNRIIHFKEYVCLHTKIPLKYVKLSEYL